MSEIFIYPTDTVWGIGCSALDQESLQEIYQIKGSDPNKPSSILFPSLTMLQDFLGPKFPIPQDLFELETTLLIPLDEIEKRPPKWIYTDSHFIGVRVVSRPWIDQICQMRKAPMTTTSLNLKGEKPAFLWDDVKQFHTAHFPQAKLYEASDDLIMSGEASTIIQLGQENKIIRQGRYWKKIQELIS